MNSSLVLWLFSNLLMFCNFLPEMGKALFLPRFLGKYWENWQISRFPRIDCSGNPGNLPDFSRYQISGFPGLQKVRKISNSSYRLVCLFWIFCWFHTNRTAAILLRKLLLSRKRHFKEQHKTSDQHNSNYLILLPLIIIFVVLTQNFSISKYTELEKYSTLAGRGLRPSPSSPQRGAYGLVPASRSL